MVECLLGNGADVQLKGGKGQEAALHIAARIDEAKGLRIRIKAEDKANCRRCFSGGKWPPTSSITVCRIV